MLYKFIDENTIEPCPDCGISNGNAISNLPVYYAENPEKAVEDGYYPLNIITFVGQVLPTQELITKYSFDEENQTIYTVYEVVEKEAEQVGTVESLRAELLDLYNRIEALS